MIVLGICLQDKFSGWIKADFFEFLYIVFFFINEIHAVAILKKINLE